MNRFNKKGTNNVKAKKKQREQKRRDRITARHEQDAGTVLSAKRKTTRLAVSGVRTGKHQRKMVRGWQKSQASALESGAVTMEDIIQYSSQRPMSLAVAASEAAMRVEIPGTSTKPAIAAAAAAVPRGESSVAMRTRSLKPGFGVKLSKKARLRIKKRSGGGATPSTTSAAAAAPILSLGGSASMEE